MAGDDDFIEMTSGGSSNAAAVSAESTVPHDERVWSALHPELERLKGDLICLVPGANVKTQIKTKFESKEKAIKAILTEKIVGIVSLSSIPRVPESRAFPTRVNFSDLKPNLAEEWAGSLDALYKIVANNPVTEAALNEFVTKKDLYLRKVGASMNAFEQQLADRLMSQYAFEPLDFTRQSLEADPPFKGDSIGQARVKRLEYELAQAEKHIGKQDAEPDRLDRILQARDRQIAELEKQQAPLSYVSNIFGCEAEKVQQSVNSLISKVTALEIDNDQLRNQITNASSLQDRSACHEQLDALQAEPHLEKLNAASSATTIKSLRDTITSLRDQLSKQGIGRSLEARLQQLGFINGSNTDVRTSASSVIDNRCESDGDD